MNQVETNPSIRGRVEAAPGNAISRRRFTALMAATGAAVWGDHLAAALSKATAAPSPVRQPICLFSKPLDSFEVGFMADVAAAAGCDGFDLTVRPGGKISPERADQELPQFAEAIRPHKLGVALLTTAITGVATPHAEKVLAAAAAVGGRHYRLGYFNYDFALGIWESLQRHRSALRDLVELNQRFGLQAGYQNHSGTRVGAAVWDVRELLRDLPVAQVSAQYDVRHAVTEGSSSWILGLRLLGGSIGSLALKDFTWQIASRKARVVNVPLGEGIVDFDACFRTVKELNLRVPITLHLEYPLLSPAEAARPLLEQQKIISAKVKRDVDFIRAQLARHQVG